MIDYRAYYDKGVKAFCMGGVYYDVFSGFEIVGYIGKYWYQRSIFQSYIDGSGTLNHRCIETY